MIDNTASTSSSMSDSMWNSSNMSDSMWNSSRSTISPSSSNISHNIAHDIQYYGGYACIALLNLLAIIVTVVNFILLLAIRDCQTFSTGIRVVLCNIVLANEAFLISVFLYSWSEREISFKEKYNDAFWNVMYVALCSTATAKLLFMATYGVTVYISARLTSSSLGTKKLNTRAVIIACVVAWWISIVPYLSHFIGVKEIKIALTFCMGKYGVFYLDYALILCPIYGIVCGVISILFPILTAHYSQKVIIREKRHLLKRLIKFSIFLLLNNAVIGVGYVSLVFTLFYVIGCDEYYFAVNFIRVGPVIFSLISTPVAMLAFFECIREKFKNRICCCRVLLKRNCSFP